MDGTTISSGADGILEYSGETDRSQTWHYETPPPLISPSTPADAGDKRPHPNATIAASPICKQVRFDDSPAPTQANDQKSIPSSTPPVPIAPTPPEPIRPTVDAAETSDDPDALTDDQSLDEAKEYLCSCPVAEHNCMVGAYLAERLRGMKVSSTLRDTKHRKLTQPRRRSW